MAGTSHHTRRSFLHYMAYVTAASTMGVGSRRAWSAEPQNCAGPRPPATPTRWTPDTNPILPRLSASTLSAADVTKLQNAYQALRDLTTTQPNDPRGWLQQGDKHCWNCGGGLDQQAGEEIHGSWLFLPWHRAFLYFHERILGALINDKSLRLAYWDWENAANRTIPAAWTTPNTNANALWDANRSAVAGNQVPTSLVGPQIMNPIIGAATFTQFGGSAANGGNLENGPHGAVHIWCGNTMLNSAQADMGLLDTAAQDPIFFAHHANIDRLWTVWLQASTTHTNPTNATWLRHRFTFWDERKRWVSITVADVLNMSNNLRYTYGPAAARPAFLAAAPKTLSLQMEADKTLVLPEAVKNRMMAAVADKNLTTLRVEGVTLPPQAKGIYRIIANKPTAVAAEVAGTPNDLGYIAIVPRTSKDEGGHRHGSFSIDLDVTEQLPKLLQENGKLRLSYVPITDTAKGAPLQYQKASLIER